MPLERVFIEAAPLEKIFIGAAPLERVFIGAALLERDHSVFTPFVRSQSAKKATLV